MAGLVEVSKKLRRQNQLQKPLSQLLLQKNLLSRYRKLLKNKRLRLKRQSLLKFQKKR